MTARWRRLRTQPLLAELESGTVHAVVGVQRQWFDGGHDNVFTVGVQGRRPLDSGDWVGLEGTYNNWRVKDNGSNPVGNATGIMGLFGHPVDGQPIELWASGGFLFFSDFKRDGSAIYEGGRGWQVTVGVDLTELPFGN